MAYADRVQETTTTAGTGNVTLAGAVAGYRTFGSVFGVGDSFEYAIVDSTANAWEVGRGYLSGNTSTLSRDQIIASSNSGNVVNFAGNTANVFCTYSGTTAMDSGMTVFYRMGLVQV